MVCTWRPLVETFSILLWQARVGREIERYVREREEEMRKQEGGMTRAPSVIHRYEYSGLLKSPFSTHKCMFFTASAKWRSPPW
jgi:hypothetical protein